MNQFLLVGQVWLFDHVISGLDWFFNHGTSGVFDWLVTWFVRAGAVVIIGLGLTWLAQQARLLLGLLAGAVFAAAWALTHSVAGAAWSWQADASAFALVGIIVQVLLSLVSARVTLGALALVLAYVPFHYHAIASGRIDNGRVYFVQRSQLPTEGLGSALGGPLLSLYGSGDLPAAQIEAMYGPNSQVLTDPVGFYAAPLRAEGWPAFIANLAGRYLAWRQAPEREDITIGIPLVLPRSLSSNDGAAPDFGDALILMYPYVSLVALVLCLCAVLSIAVIGSERQSVVPKSRPDDPSGKTTTDPEPTPDLPAAGEAPVPPPSPVIHEYRIHHG